MRKLDATRSQRELAVEVGLRIKAFRLERRWTRPVLANLLEIKREWLEAYETGFRLPPPYTLYQLACLFKVSVGALLDDEPVERPIQSGDLRWVLRRVETLSKIDQREIGKCFGIIVTGVRRLLYD